MKALTNYFKSSKDMTIGNPIKSIIAFMVPMLVGNIAQQMYSTVDAIIVGEYVGDNALAAVGSVTSIFNLLLVLFIGISVGAGIIVAQYFGAKDRENISKSVGACMILTFISSLAIMAIAPFISRPILELLNTPVSIIDWSSDYLMIMLIGIGGMAFYNILCGVMRGLGDSIAPLKYLLVASVLNIVLDLLFVVVFNMEVAGVAYATVIAQFISAILCVIKIFRMKDVFDFHRKYLRWNKSHIHTIVKLGLPSGLTQMVFSLAMVIMQPLTNSYGELFIAANVIVMRVDGFAMMPNISFGSAMTTYAGQNVGAKQYERVLSGARQGTLLAMATASIITLLILLFGNQLVSIFTDTVELIDMSMTILCVLAVGYIAMSITQSLSGVMRGAGDTVSPMWISIISTVIIRVPLAYGLSYIFNNSLTLYISLLASWVIGALLTIIVYKKGKWKTKAVRS